MASPARFAPPAALGLSLCLLLAALALAAHALADQVPPGRWWPALLWPDPADMAQVAAAYSALPRLAVSLLAGAALGLSGGLLQHVLRNPLAAPNTIGISAGAQLALAAAAIYAPSSLGVLGRDAVAFAGGAGAVALVLLLAWRGGLAPVSVLLCGLVVGLYLGSLSGVLVLLHTRQLAGLFVWGSGSLVQLGWGASGQLLLRLALGAGAATLLARPLRLLELPDGMARGLGVPVPLIRLAGLGIAVALGSSVVSLVGVIGFVGLGAPALVRLADGARPGLLRCMLAGAALLALTDQAAQLASSLTVLPLPTGAVAGLLGAPLLLLLMTRLVPAASAIPVAAPFAPARPLLPMLAGAAVLLALVVAAALLAGPSAEGWRVGTAMLPLRAPRVAAAGVAGAMLAVAGLLLQRVLGNPIASPDVLGIGAGTMLGLVAALWLGLGADATVPRLLMGAAGGAAALAVIMAFSRGGTATGRMLLAGLSLGAAFESGMALLLASGNPRGETVLAWLSGSTYLVGAEMAGAAALGMIVLLAFAGATVRWLDLLALGPGMARSLGLRPGPARAALLLVAAALSGVATLLVGPLSFVGLLAPHLVRLAGLHRAAAQLPATALCGAIIMVLADWAGRTLLFPAEIPAGVVAALVGGPVLLWALSRGRS
ncbi:MAG: Fe(3+)-hydroxamate ABC transporter permease FhuB [Janthinobacterium lividum]